MNINHLYTNPHALSCPWYELTETYGAPNVKWCEETLCAWISEPANTWTNLGMILVGLWAYYVANQQKKTGNTHPFWQLMPFSILFMGVSSFLYHASNFYLTQVIDLASNYMGMVVLIHLNLERLTFLGQKSAWLFTLVGTLLLTLLLHYCYVEHLPFQLIVPVEIVIFIAMEYWLYVKNNGEHRLENYRYLMLALGTFLVAISFSMMDHNRVNCDPHNHFIQGHALWHLFCALGFYFVILHGKVATKKLKKT